MRFTKKIGALAILVASLGAAGVVAAQEGAPADRKAQHEQRRAEMIGRFDTNKDGKLDESERKAMRDTLTAEHFTKLDTNGDGVLSLAEFQAGAEKMGHHFRHHGPDAGKP